MLFAGLFDILDTTFTTLFDFIHSLFRSLFYLITELIYNLIIDIYNAFETLCNARLLDLDVISDISKRVGLILGIIMFLIVSFSFIQIILDPEKINDKEIGINSIVKKIIIVIILIGSSTYVFSLFDGLEKNLIKSGIIETILLPSGYSVNTEQFGGALSADLFLSFYDIDNDFKQNGEINPDLANNGSPSVSECSEQLKTFRKETIETGSFPFLGNCLNATADTETGNHKMIIKYNYIFCLLVGLFVCYFLIMYTIDVGTRVVQIAFLEMVSSAAIIGYLSPKKDNIFTKWWKMYISTYLDVFIRIAIINVAVYLISIVIDAWNAGLTSSSTFMESIGGQASIYIKIIMIIGIFNFARKAPELIKELMPSGGASKLGFGLSTKDRPGLGMVAGTVAGAATGVIGGAMTGKGFSGKIRGALSGAAGGTARGFTTGFSGKGTLETIKTANANQAKANLARAQRITRGTSLKETASDRMRSLLGVQPGFTKLEQELSVSNAVKTELEKDDIIKHIQEVRQSYIQKCAAEKKTADASVLKRFDDATKNVQKSMYDIAMRGSTNSGTVSAQVFDQNGTMLMDLNELYESNPSIYNAIKKNNNRVHREMNTYDEWKADNKEIQRKLSEKSNTGSK